MKETTVAFEAETALTFAKAVARLRIPSWMNKRID